MIIDLFFKRFAGEAERYQQMFPEFIGKQEGVQYSTRAIDFVREYVMSHEEDDLGGLYHTTTNIDRVMREGLRSRSGTGQSGLGGGVLDEAPNMISVTYDDKKAYAIYEDLMRMVDLVVGNVRLGDIFISFMNIIDDKFDDWWFNVMDDEETKERAEEIAIAFGTTLNQYGISDLEFMQALKNQNYIVIVEKLNSINVVPSEAYRFYQEMEDIIVGFEGLYGNPDFLLPTLVTGFTSNFKKMQNLRAENIGIVQVAIRVGAEISVVPRELEIRVFPSDVVVIGRVK
jgi:hypothetical protein